jgi:hypothetical protein
LAPFFCSPCFLFILDVAGFNTGTEAGAPALVVRPATAGTNATESMP